MGGFKVRRTILAAFGVALALDAALCLLPENGYQRWQLQANYMDGVLPRIYERIHFDPKPIDIAILGPSHAQLGLSAAAVEDRLAQHGKRASVVNVAIGGTGENIQWAIVDELFKSKSPKAIVLDVDDQPHPFGHFAFRYVAPRVRLSFRRRHSFTTISTTSLICRPARRSYSAQSCFRTCSACQNNSTRSATHRCVRITPPTFPTSLAKTSI
jgi:hypothetical protein